MAEGCGDRSENDEQDGDTDPAGHGAIEGSVVLSAHMRF